MSVFQDKSSAQAVLPAHQLPRIYQELPFAHPARLVLLANVSSWIPVFVSTHTEQPPAPIFTLVRTQPHPNHPIRYASPQSNTLVFSNVVRCKCQRVDLACWGPAPEES